MSMARGDRAQSRRQPRNRSEVLATLAALALGALALAWVARDRVPPIDRSAIGHRALVAWLADRGQQARIVAQGPIPADSFGLRILPVLDTRPGRDFVPPEDRAAYLATGTEREISDYVLRRKAYGQPTLVVAPKWTRAMRLSGFAHESLLLPVSEASGGLAALQLHDGPMVRPQTRLLRPVYRDAAGTAHTGMIFAPQLFPDHLAETCTPLISAAGGHLLIACALDRSGRVLALSDPDLLNNHGLRLAGNAGLVAALMADLTGGAPVIVDISTGLIVVADSSAPQPRDWSSIWALGRWPYSVVWAGLAVLSALVLWRAWVRIGAPRRLYDDRLSAERSVSIAAKARLLHLTGNQAPLLAAHVQARLRRLEVHLFGRALPGDPQARILALVARSDADLATAFAAATTAATTATADLGDVQMARLLDSFETLAESVVHATR